MNLKITKAELRLEKARENLHSVIKEVQKQCKHPKDFVYEGDYNPETEISYAEPPFRVCSKCGLAEVGWGIGWHTLPETDLKLSRDKARVFVKYMIGENEKCEMRFGKKLK
jgi:hypothetical protein